MTWGDVDNVVVYRSADAAWALGDTPLGSAVPASSSVSVAFPAETITTGAPANHFFVVLKLKATADATNTVGASLGTGSLAVSTPDQVATTNFPLSSIRRAAGAGYRSLPSGQTLFFGERGAGEYEDIQSLDLSLQYSIPVWKTLEPWIKFSATNIINEDGLVTFNTQIIPNTAAGAPRAQYGLPTTYTKGVNFGKGTANANYQIPREYFVSVGIRFTGRSGSKHRPGSS